MPKNQKNKIRTQGQFSVSIDHPRALDGRISPKWEDLLSLTVRTTLLVQSRNNKRSASLLRLYNLMIDRCSVCDQWGH